MNNPDRARRATIVDVGRHAGVSTASVSKVLRNAYGVSESMRERVHQSMLELGYRPHRPARGMRGRTFTVGMMVADLENPFFNLLADGISSVLRDRGYELLVSPAGLDPITQNSVVEALIDHQMDGLILVAPLFDEDQLNRIASEVPVVAVGLHGRSSDFDSVAGDDLRGAALVVNHLVELGHRKIAFVSNNLTRERSRPEAVRLRGFKLAMKRHGLTDDAIVLHGSWNLDGGRDAARAIAAMDRGPTAVHSGADIVALGIMTELWEGGHRVPEAYSLVGYDNSKTSAIGPIALTTVDQAGYEMGRTAGLLLMERIEGRSEARHELLQPTLVIRSTTASL